MRLRGGVFYFLLLMLFLEGIRQALPMLAKHKQPNVLQLNAAEQAWIDSLKQARANPPPLRRTDPNRLGDYTGYRLGLSVRALDSLYAYRTSGRTIYDAETLGRVAGLPDTTLNRIRPLLRFPPRPGTERAQASAPVFLPDLNAAPAEALRRVKGVGPVLSGRIVKFREAIGGFQHVSQLYDVYGLPPEVAARIMASFKVARPPEIRKIHLNTASAEELAGLLYLTPDMARALVAWRQQNGPYETLDDIGAALDLPREKIERIALYLTL